MQSSPCLIINTDEIEKLIENGEQIYENVMTIVAAALIERTLIQCYGNQTQAAKVLGIHRSTIKQKLKAAGKIKSGA